MVKSLAFRGLAASIATMTAPVAFAQYGLNMPVGVTEISREVYDLHMLIFWICCVIGVAVFGVMAYSIVKHRKSKGHAAAHFHESTSVEIAWTVVPFLILVGMAIPAAKTLIAMEDTSAADLTIKVTGYQWKWEYEYMDGPAKGLSFFSNLSTPREQIENRAAKGEHYLLEVDNPVVVPVGKKVRFLLTSNDVIHAWWVPDLAVKKDAVPGFINEMWTRIELPGTYRGQCAELCGKDHGFMPVVVVAKDDVGWMDWAAEQNAARAALANAADRAWSKDELIAKGEAVYQTNCAACHQANGQGVPGVFPGITGGPISTGPIAGHIEIVMNGKAGTAMQAFGKQLSDVDLAAVVSYQRNGLGNSVGDFVEPQAIKSLR
ncbi:MAG: cytochrome c oxidase subunit II [Thiotrichales bacterium]